MHSSETIVTRAGWELLASGRTPAVGTLLRLDHRAIPAAEIRGFVATTDHEPRRGLTMVLLGAFGIIGLGFMFGVVDTGMRGRFLGGAMVAVAIVVAAVEEMMRLTTSGVFRIDILTSGGETLRHSTPDVDDHAALLVALGSIVGHNSATVRSAPSEAANFDVQAGSRAAAAAA